MKAPSLRWNHIATVLFANSERAPCPNILSKKNAMSSINKPLACEAKMQEHPNMGTTMLIARRMPHRSIIAPNSGSVKLARNVPIPNAPVSCFWLSWNASVKDWLKTAIAKDWPGDVATWAIIATGNMTQP